ncbi:MAG: divergent polysaccharide deacetylase family protein [Chromatiales bacterium]|nr:divergent polysaccharide deacetylase family protein [Chromatiales bacterium]
MRYRLGQLMIMLWVCACSTTPVQAADQPLPAISIIIDDMGNNLAWGKGVLAVPGALTYAFLPHTPHAANLAAQAHDQGKEVMLHLPMQSHNNNKLGPGGLTLHLTEGEFKRTLQSSLDAVPYVVGLNNHMGSLLTRHPGAMGWLMESIGERGDLYFVDSRTTVKSVGYETAREYGIPSATRDVFLDNVRDQEAITKQFIQLIDRARRKGYAIGIGHPYPETAQALQSLLVDPEKWGVRLIPASEMIAIQGRNKTWPQPSSPSLKVARNSKLSLSLTCCEEQE